MVMLKKEGKALKIATNILKQKGIKDRYSGKSKKMALLPPYLQH